MGDHLARRKYTAKIKIAIMGFSIRFPYKINLNVRFNYNVSTLKYELSIESKHKQSKFWFGWRGGGGRKFHNV